MFYSPLHEGLIGGLFCVGVDFTADCLYWTSRKTEQKIPVFWCRSWPCLQPILLRSRTVECVCVCVCVCLTYVCIDKHRS